MKKLITLCLVGLLFFSDCSKDDEYTGKLTMTFKINPKTNYSDISIVIYSFQNLSIPLSEEKPDSNGNYIKELLPGNYLAKIYFYGNRANPTFQIINGETKKFEFDYTNLVVK